MRRFELNDVYLTLTEQVAKKMLSYIQNTPDKPEAGGILLGYYFGNNQFSIVEVSTPSSEDKATRYGFVRSKTKAQKLVREKFVNSKGKIIYLGEWHTHPEEFPTPSCIDRKSILERTTKDTLNSDVIFMIIVGYIGVYIAAVNKEGFLAESMFNLTTENR
jgi:integrative and conjugative element protein (TIGR02256 family)